MLLESVKNYMLTHMTCCSPPDTKSIWRSSTLRFTSPKFWKFIASCFSPFSASWGSLSLLFEWRQKIRNRLCVCSCTSENENERKATVLSNILTAFYTIQTIFWVFSLPRLKKTNEIPLCLSQWCNILFYANIFSCFHHPMHPYKQTIRKWRSGESRRKKPLSHTIANYQSQWGMGRWGNW